jgi:hypothetical protein
LTTIGIFDTGFLPEELKLIYFVSFAKADDLPAGLIRKACATVFHSFSNFIYLAQKIVVVLIFVFC